VAKHTAGLAEKVAESGAIEPLVECLSQFDPSVKEAAASALANIAKHSGELAQLVVDQDAIPLLLLCAREPEAHLKQAALGALSNICKHSPELAQAVIDADGIGSIAPLIDNPKTSKHASLCLSNIAKHSVELAQYVVEGEIFPRIFVLLKDNDPITRRNAASCIREIVKQTPELSGIVVSAGGLPAIVSYISIDAEEDAKLPGIMSLGFISAFDETFAASVIKARAVEPIGNILSTSTSDHIKAASAWALGQIGQHSPDHSRAVTDHNILQKLMDCYLSSKSSEDLKKKAKHALKSIILKCIYIDALAPLLHEKAPHKILKYIVKQYSKVLPNDVEAKRKFAATRGLAKLQHIVTDDEELKESIQQVILCYPDEVIKFYSPDWYVVFNFANSLGIKKYLPRLMKKDNFPFYSLTIFFLVNAVVLRF
jgi:hypothetical protein